MQVTRTYLAGSPRPVNRLGQADRLVFLHRLLRIQNFHNLPSRKMMGYLLPHTCTANDR